MSRIFEEGEYIDLRNVKENLWNFYKHTNERDILTDQIIRIINPKRYYSMIDIGCGEGNLVMKIHNKIDYCVALDPDKDRLNFLRGQLGSNSNVTLINKKFEDYSADRKFDITVSCHTLSFFKGKFEMIGKMISITRTPGRIILVLHSEISEQMKLLEYVNRMIFNRNIKHLYAETLCKYFKTKGYNVKLIRVKTRAEFKSIDEILKLSFFLFRIDFRQLSTKKKHEITNTITKKLAHKKLLINSVHGVLVINL
jgi:ubiquinone/menaquinone biosynthesis C-methylase UbiE